MNLRSFLTALVVLLAVLIVATSVFQKLRLAALTISISMAMTPVMVKVSDALFFAPKRT